MDTLEGVQQSASEVQEGLQHLSCEGRLRAGGGEAQGDLTVLFCDK